LNFVLAVLTAFPTLAHGQSFPGRNIFMWLLVAGMILNVGLVPWYLTISNYDLIDTIWALVLPTALPIWNVIILMNFFRNIPKEMDEAARIDGANPWQLLWHVYLPTSLPAMATITLFSLVGHWNSFFDGLILMNNPDNYPLQTYIQQLVIAQRTALSGGQAQLLGPAVEQHAQRRQAVHRHGPHSDGLSLPAELLHPRDHAWGGQRIKEHTKSLKWWHCGICSPEN
jgi:putative aldouronate transport system permease protein